MTVVARFCDESDHGFGWIVDEAVGRTSHALVADGGVWFVDPVAWPEAERRALELAEPRGVIQLLDRHERDARALAGRLAVPHHVVPSSIEGAPFEFVRIAGWRWWREVALWWPEHRVLVFADALGTIGYFRAPRERIGVHPLLRMWPPRQLGELHPQEILCGHGTGVAEDAGDALAEALRTARRRLPAAWLGALRRVR